MLRLPTCGVAVGVLLMSLLPITPLPAQSGKGAGEMVITTREVERRARQAESAERLLREGDKLAAAGDHCEAAEKFRQAAQLLRFGAPATAVVREEAVRKFSSSGVECAKELARNGDYEKAKARLNQILASDMAPRYAPALALMEHLDDPDRYNSAMTPRHAANVKKVSRLLMMADHYVQIGDFDAGKHAYNQALAEDPTNTAARRGLENVEKLIEEYLKSARDHTRLKMLNDVDRMYETRVPYASGIRPIASAHGEDIALSGSPLAAKLRSIVIPRLAMTDATIIEAISYLTKKSIELDNTPDESRRGVNIIWSPGPGGEAGTRPVTLDLRNVSLGDALRAVCEMSGTRFTVDGAVVRVSVTGASAMETRQFRVPPGFLSTASTAAAAETSVADPFAAAGTAEAKPKLGRLDPKTFLEQSGVQFPEGARAGYNPVQNLLIVTNTAENLEAVAALVDTLTTSSQRQVMIRVVLLKTTEQTLEELSSDIFLEPFGVGNDKVFAAGGTAGNSELSPSANTPGTFGSTTFLPVQAPFGVVQGPITGGLRSSFELTRNQSIDDLINISTSGLISTSSTRPPAFASVAGVFTDPRFQTMLRGLSQKKGIDLSVANSVVVKSGQRATSFSGRDFFYPTEFDPPQIPQTVVAPRLIVQDTTTGQIFQIPLPLQQPPVTPATPNSFEKKEVGSNIEVEPTIGEDGYTVDLNLAVYFSEFDGFINYGTPIFGDSNGILLTENRIIQPVFSRVAATTQVLVYDGQTVAIGGLSASKTEIIEDKVPGWSSIPLIGRFFKSNVNRTTRSAVVYFVTVNIVDPSGERTHAADVLNADAASSGPAESVLPDSILDTGVPVNTGK